MVDASAWTAVSSWATPSALFLLLNLVIAFIAIIASRKNNNDPPPQHHYNYNHHQIHQEPPPTLLRAPSLFSRVTSFDFSNLNHSVSYSHHHPSDESVQYASATANDAVPPPIARAPSFLSRMTSFSRLYQHHHLESETHYDHENHAPPQSEPIVLNRFESEKKSDESVPYTSVNDDAEPVSRAPSFLSRMTSFNRSSEEKPDEPRPAIARAPSFLTRMASFNFSLHRSTEPEPETETETETEGAREEHVTRSATEPKRKKKPVKRKKSSSEKSSNTETASFTGRNDEGVDAKADDFINKFKQQLRLQRLDSLLRYRSSAGES